MALHQVIKPIAGPEQLRAYLKQVPGADAPGVDADVLLLDLLTRATALIWTYLKFKYEGYTAPSQKVVTSYGSEWLMVPAHKEGSITQVLTYYDQAVPSTSYSWDPGQGLYLVANAGFGTFGSSPDLYQWLPGRYKITAEWGWGEPPEDLVQVCLEIATNFWRDKDKGSFSDAIGVEGNGELRVGYQKGLTNRQELILSLHRQRLLDSQPVVIG